MKQRPLLIGAEEQKDLSTLKEHAERYPLSMDDLLDIMNLSEPAPGDREGFMIMLPVGYRVVFTIEWQPEGMARHLSVSVLPLKPNVLPNPAAVIEICKYLGFKGTKLMDFTSVHCDDTNIINVIEYI